MSLSFPYPTIGSVTRPPGQGCVSCVHKGYCPAMYWYRRFLLRDPDNNVGRACNSWSDVPQPPPAPTQDDLNEVEYISNQEIGSEANSSGISCPTTGTSRRP